MVARTLAAGLRGLDVVGRWGGEEFLAVVTNPSRGALTAIANRMRVLVAASRLSEPVSVSVTVSIGATVAEPGEAAADVLRRADENLYRAKKAGRDRVCGGEP
jgi:diguanylate cyclase (GGDEF)-like protein